MITQGDLDAALLAARCLQRMFEVLSCGISPQALMGEWARHTLPRTIAAQVGCDVHQVFETLWRLRLMG